MIQILQYLARKISGFVVHCDIKYFIIRFSREQEQKHRSYC